MIGRAPDVARQCEHVDVAVLAAALADGTGRAEVHTLWRVAQRPQVRGSAQLFDARGYIAHNPGATHHRMAPPPGGFPHLEHHRTDWADELLDGLIVTTRPDERECA